MEQSLTLKDGEGRTLSAVLAQPPAHTDKAVVLCHGFMGFKDSVTNRALSRLLTEQGVAALRFDFFGHGSSEGRLHDLLLTTLISQADAALGWMRGNGFARLALFGSSFGGLVALLAAARLPSLRALALRCPVADFPDLLRQRFGRLAVELWRRVGTVPPSLGHVPVHGRFYDDCLKYDPYRAAAQLGIPTIVAHGGRDELIPLEQVRRLYEHLGGEKQWHLLPEADHRFSAPKDFASVNALLADWLVQWLSRPVSH